MRPKTVTAKETAYKYLAFRSVVVASVIAALTDLECGAAQPGGYLSDEPEVRAIRQALREGYRWVFNADTYAIFELDRSVETATQIPG